jgi:hypothetical protein
MWRRAVCSILTDVLLKRRLTSTIIHGVTLQKAALACLDSLKLSSDEFVKTQKSLASSSKNIDLELYR